MAPKRAESLDALRGLAVLGMVLSGSIAFGALMPGWMFHAQVPPPAHRFMPQLPGISWVDLVFPFFLFSLGAALPMALHERSGWAVLKIAVRRLLLIGFLALFTQQLKPAVISASPGWLEQVWAVCAFVVLGLALTPGRRWVRLAGYLLAGVMLLALPLNRGQGFSTARSDIILLVLAHMACWGALLWWASRAQPLMRWGVLLPLAAVLLGGLAPGSWNAQVLSSSPVPALFQVQFLKYLFIVVPGMVAGEWLREEVEPERSAPWLVLASLGLIALNTALLFRHGPDDLTLNLLLTLVALALMLGLVRKGVPARLIQLGAWLLLSGLALEAFQGGIKKDSATFAYFFVTAGLSCFALLALRGLPTAFLAMHGRNPLLAYVAGALVVSPLFKLTGLHTHWASLNQSFAQGLFKGILFTGCVSALTWFCSKRGWIWKS